MIKYTEELKIYTHYTDFNGRLSTKFLCDLFNDVANEQTLHLHFDVGTLRAQGLTWMLHKLHVQVGRLPLKGENVTLETWPSGTDRLFAFRDFNLLASDGERLVEASSEWMVIDLQRRRPVRLPAVVMEVAQRSGEVTPCLQFTLDARNFPVEVEQECPFSASYSSIDFNKHVTQAAYVGWVIDSLPFDFLKQHELRELEIVYEHEILPGSNVWAGYWMELRENGVEVGHRVRNEARDRTHCVARTHWKRIE